MSFFLSKFLLFLIKPLVWITVLMILSFFAKTATRKRNFLFAGLLLLLIFSNRFLVGQVARWYEPKFPEVLQRYDVGILLGGFSSYNTETSSLKAQFAGDRLTQTIKLYHQGVFDKILMSGGSGALFEKYPVEAIYTNEYLKETGIPDSAIIIEKESRNTKENFLYANRLLKHLAKSNTKVLVITSAWHIPRTKLIAEKQGLKNFEYYPTNSLVDHNNFEDYLVPQAGAIWAWEILIKEWIGFVVTKIGLT